MRRIVPMGYVGFNAIWEDFFNVQWGPWDERTLSSVIHAQAEFASKNQFKLQSKFSYKRNRCSHYCNPLYCKVFLHFCCDRSYSAAFKLSTISYKYSANPQNHNHSPITHCILKILCQKDIVRGGTNAMDREAGHWRSQFGRYFRSKWNDSFLYL